MSNKQKSKKSQLALCQKIENILTQVQFNKTCHGSNFKKLRKIYNETDPDEFYLILLKLLKVPLSSPENNTQITNTLEFAAKFIIGLNAPECEENNLVLLKFYTFLTTFHDAKTAHVRFHICQFLQMLLTAFGDDAIIDDNIHDKICTAMLERMKDLSAKVRVQAALALHRLQAPYDENCPVMNCYLFHMVRDPNADVRKTVADKIAKSRKALGTALKCIYDSSAKVRVAAYTFISKITVRSLTIEQREKLLKNGLQDTSVQVVACIKKVLLPTWLNHYNHNYIDLLKGLDPEKALEFTITSMDSLLQFNHTPIKELLKQTEYDDVTQSIPIEKLSSANVVLWRCLIKHVKKVEPEGFEEIMPELTRFCKYIIDYMSWVKDTESEMLEISSPEFILYQLFEMTSLYEMPDEVGKDKLKQLIMETLASPLQSERIVKCAINRLKGIVPEVETQVELLIDVINELRMPSTQTPPENMPVRPVLSDKERKNLRMKQARLGVEIYELEENVFIASREKRFIDAERIQKEVDVLKKQSEEYTELLREPQCTGATQQEEVAEERNDPCTLISCLRIMCNFMGFPEMEELSGSLRTLMENLVLPNIQHVNMDVRCLAIIALGLCCYLDVNLTSQHLLHTFFLRGFTDPEPTVNEAAIKIIFDLLCEFGFEPFSITYVESGLASDKNNRTGQTRLYTSRDDSFMDTGEQENFEEQLPASKLIPALMDLLEKEDEALNRILTVGFLKLMTCERMNSCQLLSRFIIQLHSPQHKRDISTRKQIVDFLNYYSQEVSSSPQVLEKVYFYTLEYMEDSLDTTGYVSVNQHRVAKLLLLLTDDKNSKSDYRVHNNIVHRILDEIKDPECSLNKDVLVKSLLQLKLKIEDEAAINELVESAEAASNFIRENSSRNLQWIKVIDAFKNSLK